jgi:small subunit ribosomal protein S13
MVDKSEKTDKPVEKKEHKEAPKKKKPEVKKEEEESNMKGIVRLAGKDIFGTVRLKKALKYVRGIGTSLSAPVAEVISSELHIPTDTQIGTLSDSQIESIDKILFNLGSYSIPKFMLNRRGDMDSGADKHVIMNDLLFSVKQDVEREKKAYTWRGYRHAYGQKVRGQRTRNTGRTGMAVGVLRKTVLAQAGAPAPGAAAPGAAAPAGAPAPKAAGAPAKAAGAPAKAAAPAAKPAAKPAEKK